MKSDKRTFTKPEIGDQRDSVVFMTTEEASAAVIKLGIKTTREYNIRCKEVPGLRSKLHYYKDYPGWEIFSGQKKFYSTVAECIEAVRRLGITSPTEYADRYREDPLLPRAPSKKYKETYPGYKEFYGIKSKYYESYQEASTAAKKLNATTKLKYRRTYYNDLMLPLNPDKIYPHDWSGWPNFLGAKEAILPKPELSFSNFVQTIRDMHIRTAEDYRLRWREDPKLTRDPKSLYNEDWTSWPDIIGPVPGKRYGIVYKTYDEARNAILPFRCSNWDEYKYACTQDPKLPTSPKKYTEFTNLTNFLMPETFQTLADVYVAVRLLGIKNSTDYKDKSRSHRNLPSHPERLFSKEWVSWYKLCDIPEFFAYETLLSIVTESGFKTIEDYQAFCKTNPDPRIPRCPDKVYPEWKDWYVFLGRQAPYKLRFIENDSLAGGWKPTISEFLAVTKSGKTKESYLCRFLNEYIIPNNLADSPQKYLTERNTNIKLYKSFLESDPSHNNRRRIHTAVCHYLRHVLDKHMTVEDEETGELIVVFGASNPLAAIDGIQGYVQPSETTKSPLAYQFVEAMRQWIIPEATKSFSELTAIQIFDKDYFEVDPSKIDPLDLDCVYKERNGRFFLWCPTYWVATYTLASVPARGRQIFYNDSGEGDEYIPEHNGDGLKLVSNSSPLAEAGRSESFVKSYTENSWGMHFTTNKTNNNGGGYNVPWIPSNLAYWLVKLRNWQQKYNPVARAMPWTECAKRTHFNAAQLQAKGANFFLFRAFNEEEPPVFQPLLTERVAAALYYSQPKNLKLAEFDGPRSHSTLSHYKSIYTPHTMRVSLITALVVDFGLPPEIVMKIAGHTNVIMNIYYVKIGAAKMRKIMEDAEKKHLLDDASQIQIMIEQQRLDEIIPSMVANSEEALQALRTAGPGGTLVRDAGICPFAGARCHDGGEKINKALIWQPVPGGYLGMQNCPRCRHFITGPAFLGGLVALWNEISLEINLLSNEYEEIEAQISKLLDRISGLDNAQYENEKQGLAFDDSNRTALEVETRKRRGELERVAKKMDTYLCDLQSITKLTIDCRNLISNLTETTPDNKFSLIIHEDSDFEIEFEETSLFHHLNEVCMNAVLYSSASCSHALPRRSQMIDKMTAHNKLPPIMFTLTEREQLILGNQITLFLFNCIKSWETVDDLISGKVLIDDLGVGKAFTKREFSKLLSSAQTNDSDATLKLINTKTID